MSLSLATLDAVGRMKLDPVLRRTGAGELGTATAKCAVFGYLFLSLFTFIFSVLFQPENAEYRRTITQEGKGK